jgi:hypothetical protein
MRGAHHSVVMPVVDDVSTNCWTMMSIIASEEPKSLRTDGSADAATKDMNTHKKTA